MYFRKNSFIINIWDVLNVSIRSSRLEVFLRKGVQKICSKCTGKHQCRSAILIKLESNIIETTLRHGCSPVNLLHILWIPFVKINSGRLLLMNVVYRLTLNTTKSIDKKSIIVFVDLYFQSLCDVTHCPVSSQGNIVLENECPSLEISSFALFQNTQFWLFVFLNRHFVFVLKLYFQHASAFTKYWPLKVILSCWYILL